MVGKQVQKYVLVLPTDVYLQAMFIYLPLTHYVGGFEGVGQFYPFHIRSKIDINIRKCYIWTTSTTSFILYEIYDNLYRKFISNFLRIISNQIEVPEEMGQYLASSHQMLC